MVDYEIIQQIIYKSFDENYSDEKCNHSEYNISSQEYNNLKSKINGFVSTIKNANNKTRDLLGSIKDNFDILNNASREYENIIANGDTDKYDNLRREWEEKYPDIPFGMDIPSYNQRIKDSEKAINEYIKTSSENEKLLNKYSNDWITDLGTTNNYQDSRDKEGKFSSFIKGWKNEVKEHLGIIRGLPTFKNFEWTQQTKNEYINECNMLVDELEELDKFIYHKKE